MSIKGTKYFLITIDVEDWFHVENFKSLIPFDSWEHQEWRLERNIHRLLDLFDSIRLDPPEREMRGLRSSQQAPADEKHKGTLSRPINEKSLSMLKYGKQSAAIDEEAKKVRATFFVLCWIAEHLPHIVREIADRGHEVASHGCYHELPKTMPPHLLHAELIDSRKRLEDIIGMPVAGFRAPSFSINDEILEAVAGSDYIYDSSYNSFSLHGRYGRITLNGQPQIGIAHRIFDNFYELPISNLNVLGRVLPLGGGAYFRLIPFNLFRRGVKWILTGNNAYLFYIHPWEIDPEQPRVKEASWNHKMRHYTKLSKTYDRLCSIIKAFKYCRFTTCSQYLTVQNQDLRLLDGMCAAFNKRKLEG